MNQTLGRSTIFFSYFILAVAAVIALFPPSLMVISSLKKSTEIVANPLALPSALQWSNFSRAWTDAQLGRSLLNSTETTGLAVLLICSTCSMAAYALAHRTGPGLRWISAYLLGTTTLPIQLYLFPLYFGFAHLGLIDNVFALSFIYTAVFSPFAIFLLRTYFLAIPKELEEAAVIDGATSLAGLLQCASAAGLSRYSDGGFDFGSQHLERIPDLVDVPAEPRSTNRRSALLHARRPILQRLGRDHGRRDPHRRSGRRFIPANATPLHPGHGGWISQRLKRPMSIQTKSPMSVPTDYLERVYAGVLGKIIGVYLGRPFENWTHQRIRSELGEIWNYQHERFGVPLVVADDDISGTFTFLRALPDHRGTPDLTPEQIGLTWLNYIVENRSILWWGGMGNSTEHTAFLRLKNGIPAPMSGAIQTNGKTVAEQIGAQIFIDGWALVSPGNPGLAVELARKAASVSHDGEAIYAAQLVAAMEAQAFTEPRIDRADRNRALLSSSGLFNQAAGQRCTRLAPDGWKLAGDPGTDREDLRIR